MNHWLARLKNHNASGSHTTKPTKPVPDTRAGGFVGFVAPPPAHSENSEKGFCRFRSPPVGEFPKNDEAVAQPEIPVANTPTTGCYRRAWPQSSAMKEQEHDRHMARQYLFCQRGASAQDAQHLADSLVSRDRSDDDRRLCLECRHLHGAGPYYCGNARAADWTPDLPRDLVLTLQRCHGYDGARLPMGVIVNAAPPLPDPAQAPEPVPTPSGPTWQELDRAYQAHHTQCPTCKCAGRGYGERCATGVQLWAAYSSASN